MAAHKRQLSLVFLIVLLQLLLSCGRPPSARPCVSPIYDSLGSFDSAEAGACAAVRKLSEEIHRCSETKEYDISWNYPATEKDRGYRALKYSREDKTSGVIGYEYDPHSGTLEPTYWVEDSAVDSVAKVGGALEDFAKYQKKKP
jgi:hypothetical protein